LFCDVKPLTVSNQMYNYPELRHDCNNKFKMNYNILSVDVISSDPAS